MQGRRRPDDTAPWELEAGDYCLRGGHLWVCLPSGVGPARLEGWDVTWHDDGTVTASPSIHDVGTADGWHGYLEHGVWRAV
jgi:hypothetical protein